MATRTIYEEHKRCGCCGAAIDREVFEAQQEIGGYTAGADCRDCLEETPDAPQFQQLLDDIRDALDPGQRDEWDESDPEDRFYFALSCINKGIVTGGSPGFHDQLRKYVCLKALDNGEAENAT